MFRTVPLSIIRSFSLYAQQWYMSAHIPLLCVQRKTPDDGQRNCPKYVEFYSKNKFEKLVHLVGFIIRIYHDARSPKRLVGFIIRIYHDARSPERLVGFNIRIYHDARSPERQFITMHGHLNVKLNGYHNCFQIPTL